MPNTRHDPYAALRHPGYRLFLSASFLGSLAHQAFALATGWMLFERTQSALILGLAGLARYLPLLIFNLPAGHAADRFSRKLILLSAAALMTLCSLGMAFYSTTHASPWPALGLIFLSAMGVTFWGPASNAYLLQLLPRKDFANAVTWNSQQFQVGSILGPIGAGWLIARFGIKNAFLVLAVIYLAAGLAWALVKAEQAAQRLRQTQWSDLIAGWKFVFRDKLVLGALTLDFMSVLFGGAVALLPLFSKVYLGQGAMGLGYLAAASFMGAFVMGFYLAHRPGQRYMGRRLLLSVAGFGICMLVFAYSRSFALSFAMLFISGALDNISVVVRHTLVSLRTPEHLRGRVTAVNQLFIGSSNELGEFESGIAAQWLGPIAAVAWGGLAVLGLVLASIWAFPDLAKLDRLDGEASRSKD